MSNFFNSLIYNFSNILSIGPEPPREGEEQCGTGCCQGQQSNSNGCCKDNNQILEIESVKILYSSLTGTAKTFANEVEEKLKNTKFVKIQKLETMDITDYDNDNLLNETSVCIFILATYNVEGPLDW
jgi:tRNA wybutosine-synthesizing protein 1